MKDSLHTLIYAGVLGLVCAVLLAAAAGITAPYKESNAKAEELRNILEVLEVPLPANASSKQIEDAFAQNVARSDRDGLKYYEYRPQGSNNVKAVAVTFSGQGLWGPIEGFLALQPDMTTISGITFHKQEETPGLGGEISAPWFRNQFKGKRIRHGQRKGITLRAGGSATEPNEVDAISGATMTCQKVENMLNDTIAKVVKEPDANDN